VLSSEDQRHALLLARGAIDRALGPSPPADPAAPFRQTELPAVFEERRGVFVTLKRYPGDTLRGCIGYPLPVLSLRTGVPRAAVAAAVEDPRFAPLRAPELPRLVIEISVLTVPVLIDSDRPEERRRAVTVGRDGLIVEGFGCSGLLLPQVAPEQGWTAEELLEGTCEKAGLRADAWRNPAVVVRRFEAEVFRERVPGGEPVAQQPPVSAAGGRAAPRS
jgi:uncharacterized protein (TIGR00296 family)